MFILFSVYFILFSVSLFIFCLAFFQFSPVEEHLAFPSVHFQTFGIAKFTPKIRIMLTRAASKRRGMAIVNRARAMGIVPDYKMGLVLKKQTFDTQWALHVIAVMSKGGEIPREEDVRHVIAETTVSINSHSANLPST